MPDLGNTDFALLKKDNALAFRRIYEEFWEGLFRVSFGILQDEALAKDIVQEVFVTIWTKRKTLDISHGKAYLYRAVKLRCFEYLRKGRIPRIVLDRASQIAQEHTFEDNLDLMDTQQRLEKGMANIPKKSLQVFKMSRFQKLSNQEIAEELQVSPKTVEYHITKSLRHLRQVLTSIYFFF
ncbi:MAG: RNA polymerase sigma-70 factor [Bacteroidota bacterium]